MTKVIDLEMLAQDETEMAVFLCDAWLSCKAQDVLDDLGHTMDEIPGPTLTDGQCRASALIAGLTYLAGAARATLDNNDTQGTVDYLSAMAFDQLLHASEHGVNGILRETPLDTWQAASDWVANRLPVVDWSIAHLVDETVPE